MFWFGKDKKGEKKPSREDIMAQAMKNARAAREEIGEENLKRMAAAIRGEQKPAQTTPGSKARDTIRAMDKGRVADNLKIMLKENKDNDRNS